MSNTLFISYSRQEVPFVSILIKALEKYSLQTWVDYQSLIPGKPWLDQILAGINGADVFLLIVSKSSIVSKNVQLEYQHALEQKKRILLVIFEAVPLPPVLQTQEWIDFRGSFNQNINTLLKHLNEPHAQLHPPQKGFKTSFTIWLAFMISLIAVVISIPGWWTIFIPALLIPLPLRILKRDFNFYHIQFTLLTLPVILVLSNIFFLSYQFTNTPFLICLLISFLTTPLLLILLSSQKIHI